MALSEELDEPDTDWVDADEVDARRGDIFLHPRFGRCSVIRVEANERAVLRDEKGKPRTLSLNFVTVREEDPEEGRRVFRVQLNQPRR